MKLIDMLDENQKLINTMFHSHPDLDNKDFWRQFQNENDRLFKLAEADENNIDSILEVVKFSVHLLTNVKLTTNCEIDINKIKTVRN